MFLFKSGVDFRAGAVSASSILLPLLFPFLWLGAVYSLMRKQMGGATTSVGKKGAALKLSADDLTFDDVADSRQILRVTEQKEDQEES